MHLRPRLRSYAAHILDDPRLTLLRGEPRAYPDRDRFDIVEVSLVDGVGLAQVGGYPITESFTYTSDAIDDYLDLLGPEGFLSITV